MRAHLVEEVPVVADDDHRRVVRVERFFEPADRVDVEIVRRLVEQQHIGARIQCLCEQDAQFEAGGYLAHQDVVLRLVDARVDQGCSRAGCGRVAVVLGDLRLQLCGPEVVIVGRVRVGVDAVALVNRAPELDVPLQHDVEDALVLVTELVLAELAHAQPGLQHHVTRTRLQFAAQDLHERGLAASIRPDEAIAVAVHELDRDVLEQGLRIELDRKIGRGEHGARDGEGKGGRRVPGAQSS